MSDIKHATDATFQPGQQPRGVPGLRNLGQLETELGLPQFAPTNACHS